MKTRAEAVKFLKNSTANDRKCTLSNKLHFGLFELRELMDFIYEGEPLNESERIDKTHLD